MKSENELIESGRRVRVAEDWDCGGQSMQKNTLGRYHNNQRVDFKLSFIIIVVISVWCE